YADYARWQRDRLAGPVLDEQLAWWRERLNGLSPELALPADRQRPAVASGRGARLGWQAGGELAARLRGLAQESGATLFMLLLTLYEGLLGRLAGQTDVAAGVPVAGRTQVETEGVIGFFVNTLVLRLDLGGEPDVRALLARAREATLGAFAHREVPFERLVAELCPERVAARNPLFQAAFVLQNAPAEPLRLPGLTLTAAPVTTGAALFDLTLEAVEIPGGLAGYLEFSHDLFHATTAARIARAFTVLLEAAAADPAQRFDNLPLLAAEERHQLLHEWSGGPSPSPRDATIHSLFHEQARRTPNSVALTTADSEMIYAELAARASRLAQRLRGQGVGPDMPVAICLERSPLLIVALLAVLEAGGAYLPLDPAYPRERLSLMLDDLLLITEEGFAGLFEGLSADTGRRIVLDRLAADEEPSSRHVLPPDLPDSLAYILYTSGSTGQPKGVAVPHRAVVRLVRETGYSSGEVFLHQSPITFDASTLEIWGALLNGGRLVLAPPETPTLAALAALLERQHVTTLWLTASLFHQMVDDQLDGLRPLRRLLAGGDVLSPTHVGRLRAALPGLRLINGYGPTEN